MRCEQVLPYLPGYVGGDLRPETTKVVMSHLLECTGCRAESARLERARAGLAAMATAEIEPPPYLLEALIEHAGEHHIRRVLPILPVPPAELVRVVQENREAIVSAAGTAVVAAGAAWALWRAVRGSRRTQPATS